MIKIFAILTAMLVAQPFFAFGKTKMTTEIREMFIDNATNSIVEALITTKAKSCDQELALVVHGVDTNVQKGLTQIYAFVGNMLPAQLTAEEVLEFNLLGLKNLKSQNLEAYISQNATSLPASEIPQCLANLKAHFSN